MQAACAPGLGGMLACLPLDATQAAALCAAVQRVHPTLVCQLANHNSATQIVLAGHAAALETARQLAPRFGVRRTVALPVSAPFHCALMAPAADALRQALATTAMHDLPVPLVSNVTGNARPVCRR